MKKVLHSIIILTLALSLILCLASCSKSSKSSENPEDAIDTSYDPADYVQLCDYKNIPVTDEEVTISDHDLKEFIDSEMQQYASTEEITDRGVEKDDTVSINIQGSLNGEPLESLKAYYYEIKVGEGVLGLDFEENLIGMKTGETKTFEITYDDNYSSKTLAGNTIVYEVKVNYILKITEYELTDENVNYLSSGQYQTVDELKAMAEEHLLDTDFDTYKYKYLLRKLVDSCTITGYPEAQLQVYEAQMISSYTVTAMDAGYENFEDYLKDEYNMTMDSFNEYVESYCKDVLKEEMIYTLIAKLENITLSDEEYNAYMEYYAGAYEDSYYYSMTGDEFAESLGEDNVRQALLIKKTQEEICNWNAESATASDPA